MNLSYTEYLSLMDEIPVMNPDDVIYFVQGFVKSHFPSVKSSNVSVKVRGQYFLNQDNYEKTRVLTKSEENKNIPFYEIEVDNAGDIGSVVVCADGRYPGVVVYVPAGMYDSDHVDSQNNPMLELTERSVMFNIEQFNLKKDSIKFGVLKRIGETFDKKPEELTKSDIESVMGIVKTKSQRFFEYNILLQETEVSRRNPMLYARWNQTAPYNRKLEQICDYDLDYEGRPPVGCTAVAIAAAISHFEPSMMASGLTVNWSLIKESRSVYTGASTQRIRQISTLMKWIGDNINANYQCGSTSAAMEPAVSFMGNYNIYTDTKSGMDVSKILNSIETNGRIVLISASRVGGSHAWVLDGFLRTNFNNTTRNYIWANLCWNGSYDGLYLIENNNLTFEVSADRHYNSDFSIYPNVRHL
jgi:hypothetical protein